LELTANRNKQTVKETMNMQENSNKVATSEAPEHWWAKLSPVQRAFAQQIARLTDEVTGTKRIEIRRERGEIRARFVHILKRPENGCVSAIVLPEVPAGWN
jgi:hypothetical protein